MEELQHPYVLRALQQSDFHKGYLQLLEQLTMVGDVSEEEFTSRLEQLQNFGNHHRIAVIEDVDRKLVVGAGTLFIELKFARNCGKAGHIEDIVVDQNVRGQHLGQRIVATTSLSSEIWVNHAAMGRAHGLIVPTWSSCISPITCPVVNYLTEFAKEQGCYKVILDCSKDNAPFYEKCGFLRKELQMARYF